MCHASFGHPCIPCKLWDDVGVWDDEVLRGVVGRFHAIPMLNYP